MMRHKQLTIFQCVQSVARQLKKAKLSYGHGAVNAEEEAWFLIRETIRLPIEEPLRFKDIMLTEAERDAVTDIVKRRIESRQPAAYLVHKMYLQGLSFYVDERVIVPRSFIAEILPDFLLITAPKRILDLCTGSGCLAILAAYLFPDAQVEAVELSSGAAAVARRNIEDHSLQSRVTLFEGDLFQPVKGKTYDLILCNPPYVSSAVMKTLPPEYRHEPKMALAGGGRDGLDLVRRFLQEVPAYLEPGGGVMCEIGSGQVALEKTRPDLPFLWLETEQSEGEVFWLSRGDFSHSF